MTSWAIVGGGLLGIELARGLAKGGDTVTLLEADDQIGGLAAPWELDSVTWDRHYHVILASDSATRGLIDELGLTDQLQFVDARTGCFAGGTLHSVSNVLELLRFPPLRLRDKLRLGATVAYASTIRDWRRLEQIPVEAWLTRLSGRRAFEQFWAPLLRAKVGSELDRVSAAFLWAIIRRLGRARRNGIDHDQFGFVEGGYRTVLEAATADLQRAGVEVLTNARVRSVHGPQITPERPNPDGPTVRMMVRDNARTLEVDRVVLTVPAPLVPHLVRGLDQVESDRLAQVRYQGIVCASVLLDRPLSPFYVTNITDEGLPFTGVIEMTTLVHPDQFGGHHLVYLPRYAAPDDEVWGWDDLRVRHEFLSGLRRIHPDLEPSQVRSFKISRVPHVVPISELGASSRVPSMHTTVPGVFVVTSAQIHNGTLNVDETLTLAHRALPVLTGDLDELEVSALEAQ